MLADQQHAIDRELAGAERQRVLDRVREAEAVLLRQFAAEVVLAYLLDVALATPNSGKWCSSPFMYPSRNRPAMW